MSTPPSFQHTTPGTPEDVWRSDPRWSSLPALSLTPVQAAAGRLLVVAAHPDDETLGAGGLLAAAARTGVRATVVVATDGEGSHPDSPTHPPVLLARRREAESRTAVRALHPEAELVHLHLGDGHLAEQSARLEAALAGMVDADTLVFAPWREDGHPDHETAGAVCARLAAQAGARLLEYPVWLWHWGTPAEVPWPRLHRFDLDPADAARKRTAIAAHRSQVAPLSGQPGDEPILAGWMLEHFDRGFEVFFGARRSDVARPFDAMFDGSSDPWGVTDSWYEERKRAITLASLPRPRFRDVLELGCSVGVLTAELAGRAERVLGVDASSEALRRARRRCRSPEVRFETACLPDEWPPGRFDLIVLSEMGYFCTRRELTAVAHRAVGALTGDGVLVACHWRHPIEHWPLDGDAVHQVLRTTTGLTVLASHVEEDFRLDVLATGDTRSVARTYGPLG